jgi:hypothetical protein
MTRRPHPQAQAMRHRISMIHSGRALSRKTLPTPEPFRRVPVPTELEPPMPLTGAAQVGIEVQFPATEGGGD